LSHIRKLLWKSDLCHGAGDLENKGVAFLSFQLLSSALVIIKRDFSLVPSWDNVCDMPGLGSVNFYIIQ
jgi:hypothetical protein